jgi:hypothetical protein
MDRRRGTKLLLEHCDAVTRLGETRVPASCRVELALGSDLARLLTGALATRRRARRVAA